MGADQNASHDDSLEDGDENNMFSILPATKVFGAYRFVAVRTAMFKPFFSFERRKNPLRCCAVLRLMWRRRLNALHSNGWYSTSTRPERLTYLRNCPPVGFLMERKTRRCDLPTICPFCWGRERVLKPFRRFETVLYGCTGPYQTDGGTLLPVVRPDLRIVRFTISMKTGDAALGPLTDETLLDHWVGIRPVLDRKRTLEVRNFRAEYGAVAMKVFPIPKENRLGLVRTGVLLVPQAELPDVQQRLDYAEAGGRLEVYEPSKKNLATAMGRAFTYPSRLMRTDPVLTAGLLNLMRRTRLYAWYGGDPKTTFEE